MHHIANNPYDQPEQHTVVYDHVWTEPKDPNNRTGEQLNGTVTFDQQEGMPTPWQHWEEAMHFLLDEFPLHQLKTKATLKHQTRGNLTIVEPHSPKDEEEHETEYLMTTNTKFSLSLNQQNKNPDEPLVMTGTGTIYAEACPKVPLGTVRVKIEMEQNAQSPQEEYMPIKGNRTPLSEDFILKAQEINQAPADHQPRMAMELLQEARKTLNSIRTVTTQPTTSESRAVLAKFQDESFIIIRMVDQGLQARNSQIPYQEAELIGPDGHPLSWRSLMDNLSRHNTVARKTVEAHLGPRAAQPPGHRSAGVGRRGGGTTRRQRHEPAAPGVSGLLPAPGGHSPQGRIHRPHAGRKPVRMGTLSRRQRPGAPLERTPSGGGDPAGPTAAPGGAETPRGLQQLRQHRDPGRQRPEGPGRCLWNGRGRSILPGLPGRGQRVPGGLSSPGRPPPLLGPAPGS